MSYIARLRGEVVARGADWLVVDVHGVGYRITVPIGLAAGSAVGAGVTLYTHLVIRADDAQLYGFGSTEELELFQLLIGVSGVGPRSGVALLSTLSVDALRSAISTAAVEPLKKVPGIGAKTAGRIILELQPKIEAADVITAAEDGGGDAADVVAALKGLGYASSEIAEALRATTSGEPKTTEERLREVLRHFAAQR